MPTPLYSFAFNAPELPTLDWGQLEVVSRLTFTHAQRATLLVALNRYLEDIAYQEAAPVVKDLQRRLQQYRRHAEALAALLGDASPLGQAALFEALPSSVPDPAALIRLLYDLSLCARGAETSIHGRRGRPSHEGLPPLIRAWHVVFLAAGGSGRGCSWSELADPPQFTGPFLDLLDAACHQAASSLGQTPLAQAIRIPRTTLAQAIKDAF